MPSNYKQHNQHIITITDLWNQFTDTTLPVPKTYIFYIFFCCLIKMAYAWQPGAGQATTFGLWCGKIGPRFSAQTQGGLCWTEAAIMRSACLYGSSLGLCWEQVVPMLGQVGPMLSHLGPILGLCWAKSGYIGPGWTYVGHCWAMLGYVGLILGPCWAYVGPMLAYVGPMWPHVEPSWELCWGHVWAIYVETILRCQFFLYNLRLPSKASGKDTGCVAGTRTPAAPVVIAAAVVSVANMSLLCVLHRMVVPMFKVRCVFDSVVADRNGMAAWLLSSSLAVARSSIVFCNSVSADRMVVAASRLLGAVAGCVILFFFATGSRK